MTLRFRKRTSVCLIRLNYYPDTHVRRDATALTQAGYDVHVIAVRQPGEPWRDVVDGVNVYRMPVGHRRGGMLRYLWKYSAFFVLTMITLTLLHLRRRLRIVEIDNMPDFLVFTTILPKLTGAKVVLYIFDNMPDLLMRTRNVGAGHPLVRALMIVERESARFADHVIVTQEIAKQLVQSRGVPAEKLTVVLNGPDERLFAQRPPRPRTVDGTFDIVTHGLILERFGIQTLIDALPRIAREVPGVCLHIYGDGEYRQALEDQARHVGVRQHVRFHGWVLLEEIPDRLDGMDVGYVGMLCDLMLSNKLMEYVVLGIPVAVSRWSTYEHYFPEDAARYFEPGNAASVAEAMLDIYRDPEGARERAERAATLYQRYRWPVQQQIYLDLYAGLSSGGRAIGARNADPARQSIA